MPHLEYIDVSVREDLRKWLSLEEQGDFNEHLAKEDALGPIEVLDPHRSRHPLVVRAREASRGGSGAEGLRLDLRVSKALVPRTIRAWAVLVDERGKRGYRFVPGDGNRAQHLSIVVLGMRIGIPIAERKIA